MTSQRATRETIITGDRLLLGFQYLKFLGDRVSTEEPKKFRVNNQAMGLLALPIEAPYDIWTMYFWISGADIRFLLENKMRHIELAQFILEEVLPGSVDSQLSMNGPAMDDWAPVPDKQKRKITKTLFQFFRALASGEIAEADLLAQKPA